MLALFPILEALLISTSWVLPVKSFFVANVRHFMGLFSFGNMKRSQGAKSGVYSVVIGQKITNKQWRVSWRIDWSLTFEIWRLETGTHKNLYTSQDAAFNSVHLFRFIVSIANHVIDSTMLLISNMLVLLIWTFEIC